MNIIKLQVMFEWSLESDCRGQISLPTGMGGKLSCTIASVAAQSGLCLTWSQTPKTGFLMTMLIFFKLTNPFKKLSLVTKKTVFGVCDQVRLKPACAATEAR